MTAGARQDGAAPDAAEAGMSWLEVDGGSIAWRESGSGPSTVVWVHGLPLDSGSWRLQEEHFAPLARNVLLDLRGYGRSSKLPAGVRDVTQLYVDDVNALLEHLDLTDVVLVGFASAGHVALRLAAQHPQRLARLVVVNGSPRFRRGEGWPYGFDAAGVAHFTEAARSGGVRAMTDAVLDPSVVFRDVSAQEGERLRAWFEPMSLNAGAETMLGFFEGMSLDDDRALLPTITTPTLVLASTDGLEVPAEVAMYLRHQLPDARLAELPGADHFCFATRPGLVNLLIEQVLPSRAP